MCGIAGVLYKQAGTHEIGKTLIEMLDGCQHRGPDSTGFALYGEDKDQLQLRFIVPTEESARKKATDNIASLLARHNATIESEQSVGCSYQIAVNFDGDLLEFTKDIEEHAKLVSVGHTLDIIKDDGTAHEVDDIYHVGEFTGTHGIGHVRLATESAVRPEAAHPFWATGFEDIAIVHNGQITNYWKMRAAASPSIPITTANWSRFTSPTNSSRARPSITCSKPRSPTWTAPFHSWFRHQTRLVTPRIILPPNRWFCLKPTI